MQVHAGIERAWQIRAEAYARAAEAWKDGEFQSFTRAQNDNHAVSAASATSKPRTPSSPSISCVSTSIRDCGAERDRTPASSVEM